MAGSYRKPPTVKEVLAEQSSALVKATTMPPVVFGDPDATVAAFLDTVAGGATRISFNGKEGAHKDQNGNVVDDTVNFAAAPEETVVGVIKYNGHERPTAIEGRLYSGFTMPERSSLGDTDEAEWKIGLNGQPEDPWQQQVQLPLARLDTAEMFTYVTTSVTGRRAVGTLLRQYDRMRRINPQAYPIIQLKVGGFNHRDTRVGFVKVPVLAVVEWRNTGQPAAFNDALPL